MGTKIAALPAASSVGPSDLIPIDQGGVTKKATTSLLSTPGALWTTALDLDLTAEATQSLATNATYTIGGIAGWSKQNSTNDRIAMAITNGVGLVIQPKACAYDPGTGRTAPLLWLPLSALSIPNLDWSTSIRVWVRFGTESLTVANIPDGTAIAIDSNSFSWCPGIASCVALSGTVRRISTGNAVNGAGSTFSSSFDRSAGTFASEQGGMLRLDISSLAAPNMQVMSLWDTTAGPAWPDVADTRMSPQTGTATVPAANLAFANVGNVGVAARLGLAISAFCGGGSDHYLSTITRLRVDYKQ